MVIGIDIKIADNDGNLLHRYEKRFDDNAFSSAKNNDSTTFGQSLEDFLSEYLSFSGRIIREKLISSHPTSIKYYNNSSSSDFDLTSHEEIANTFENNELEFNVRIGDRSIYIGKIPLKQQSLSHTTDAFDDIVGFGKYVAVLPDNCDAFADEEEIEAVTTIDTSNGEAEIESMINYALLKAIEKYEANLYPSYRDIDYEYSELELDADPSPA